MSKILGIETSCDDTAIAIYDSEQGLSYNQSFSQALMHSKYGGVVPELASRQHLEKLALLLSQVPNLKEIDAIAYTAGPGLKGALLIGSSFACTLGYGMNKPIIAINHLEGHILAAQIEHQDLGFPFLALLVSGGHTMLVQAHALGKYQILGRSLDDAAGEAFDKIAKLMDLGYPGGPAIEQMAKSGRAGIFKLARPMSKSADLDFSFSGLKTSALHAWKRELSCLAEGEILSLKQDLSYELQQAIVDSLLIKLTKAIKQTGLTKVVIAGGVGANQYLRQSLRLQENDLGFKSYFPSPEFCTDNAAMIAYAGHLRYQEDLIDKGYEIKVNPRWELSN